MVSKHQSRTIFFVQNAMKFKCQNTDIIYWEANHILIEELGSKLGTLNIPIENAVKLPQTTNFASTTYCHK